MAAVSGVREGVLILPIDKATVNSAADFKMAVEKSIDDKRVLLLLNARAMSRYLVLGWRCACTRVLQWCVHNASI